MTKLTRDIPKEPEHETAAIKYASKAERDLYEMEDEDDTTPAQSKELEQEPAAMRHSFNGHGYKYTDIGFGNGWVDWTKHNFKDAEPLYTTPPQRKPMTDEQWMIEMVDAAMVATRDIVPRITRSQCRLIIEAAHGIKE